MAGEDVFLDTSLLAAVSVELHPHHLSAALAFEALVQRGCRFFVSPQVCREFTATLTRHPLSARTLDLDEALHHLDWLAECSVLDEHTGVMREWLRLVERHGVLGKQVHDCNIVATMKAHGVRKLATRNPDDFKRYGSEIEVEAVAS